MDGEADERMVQKMNGKSDGGKMMGGG